MVLRVKKDDFYIIDGIRNNDSKVIKTIYKNEYGRIKSMALGFKNIRLDPEDIFQEGLTRAILNIRNEKYRGDSTFSTYLYGICRNLCLKEYNRKKPLLTDSYIDIKESEEMDHFDLLKMISKTKQKLNEECRKILDLRFGLDGNINSEEGMRFEDIAIELDINTANARQRFKRCLDKIKALLSENSLFQELILQTS